MSVTRKKLLAFLIAETPVHAGGSEQLGLVDLPIQRERHTQYPKIEASSLKGAIRKEVYYRYKKHDNESKQENDNNINCQSIFKVSKNPTEVRVTQLLECLFGGETDAEDKASSISFSDAKILLFPVKNPKTVFAWVTSLHVLNRFAKELEEDDELRNVITQIQLDLNQREAMVSSEELILNDNTVVLEEYSFEVKKTDDKDNNVKTLANMLARIIFSEKNEKKDSSKNSNFWQKKLENNLVILPDNAFRDFVMYSTEIVTRIKIDPETKTVDKEKGALFNEEFLPEDTVMYTVITSQPPLKYKTNPEEVLDFFNRLNISTFQVGADATLGKGIVKLRIYNTNSSIPKKGGETP